MPVTARVHRIVWRVAAPEALDFWAARLAEHGVEAQRVDDRLRFSDPEGLEHELKVSDVSDAPLIADHPEVPREHALQGFDGVRAYASDPARSEALLRETLGFSGGEDGEWEVRGDERGGLYAYDPPPAGVHPSQGGGSIHHIAFATQMDEQEAWQERVRSPATPARRRSSTASGSAGCTSASPAACCSSSPPWARASTPTRTSSTWARS